jgi:DNA-binding NarL/FixJ family response regulator
VVDDHPVVIEGLSRLLRREPDMSVEWIAGGMAEAMRICRSDHPDLAIVDLSLGDGSGIDLIREIHALHPSMPILVMSMHDPALYAERALRAGAKGYINKQMAPRNVVDAIRNVRNGAQVCIGDAAVTPAQAPPAAVEEAQSLPLKERLRQLSDRELEVFELIGQGLRKRDIAERLHLSTNTVETHRAGIKKKLKLASASELSRLAFLQSGVPRSS